MSKRGHTSRRETVYKQLRANAHREQTTFRHCSTNVAGKIQPIQRWEESDFVGRKNLSATEAKDDKYATSPLQRVDTPGCHSAKPRVLDMETLYASQYDDCFDFYVDEFLESVELVDTSRSDAPMTFSLQDVPIRVTKPKGIKREYEVVDKVRPVLVLDDWEVESDYMSDEDWEDLQASMMSFSAPYSSAVKMGGG